MVRAGDPVRIRVTLQGLHLTTSGIATTSALLGDTITVRLGPNRRVHGVVAGPNLVTAPLAPSSP
jgi:flagella basal body P-ring formation protein FlgA